MKANSQVRVYGLLFLTFFIWGSVYVAGKLISDAVPASLLACLRCVTAMAPLLLLARKHLHTKIRREDWKYFLLVGCLGDFMTIQLVQLGIVLTGASMASLINALTPVAVTILAALILKEAITPIKCLCLVLALVGTVVITSGSATQSQAFGAAAVLLSVVSWGVASVYMRRLTSRYPAILVTTYGMALSLIFHIPVGIVTAATQQVTINLKVIAVLLYLGFVGSGVAQYTWTKSLAVLPASTCSLFYPLQAVFSALLGVLILSETFTPNFFLGLLLITADVALNTWEARRLDQKSAAKK